MPLATDILTFAERSLPAEKSPQAASDSPLQREDTMRVGIATDHGGFALKQELVARLRGAGNDIADFGAHDLNAADDYPDFVIPLAQAVAAMMAEPGPR